jgi:cobalamin biosynthesis protein CobT
MVHSDNANLLLSDPRYKTIPIVISSTKPKNTHVTVNDTLDVTLNDAYSAGEAVIGHSNKPLEIARKCSEPRQDITALYRAPTIKNSSMLNRFMGQRNTADGQNHGSAEGEDGEEEEEEEEEQQQQQKEQKEQGEQEEQGD